MLFFYYRNYPQYKEEIDKAAEKKRKNDIKYREVFSRTIRQGKYNFIEKVIQTSLK